MALRYILAGSTAAVGAYYAPAAYKLYEAESEVTAAERSLADLETRVKTYDGDIARAKAAVKRGAAEFAAARAEAVVAVEATTRARRAEAATRVWRTRSPRSEMTAKVAAVQAGDGGRGAIAERRGGRPPPPSACARSSPCRGRAARP